MDTDGDAPPTRGPGDRSRSGRRRERTRSLPLQPLGAEEIARHTAAHDALREALMDGVIEPGTVLSIRGLARALGTSTMPAREALRRLSAQGALEGLPNGAYRVPVMSRRAWLETLDLRLKLERLAVKRATGNVPEESLARLEEIQVLTSSVPPPDTRRVLQLNRSFHFEIYRAAGSALLLDVITMLWLRVGPHLHACTAPYDIPGVALRHRKILDALHSGDGRQAAAVLREDLLASSRTLLPTLKDEDDDGAGMAE